MFKDPGTGEVNFKTTRSAADRRWSGALDIVLIPGVPHAPPIDVEEDIYPTTTVDIVKILRSEGVRIDYADASAPRKTLDLKSTEVWLPIVVFTSEVAAHGLGGLLTHAILELLGRKPRSHIHARIGRVHSDQHDVEWLDVDGPADAATTLIERFLKNGNG